MAAVDTRQLGQWRREVIDKRDIIAFSRELGLASNVVEKDYILG
jgi:hypothetical protein